MPKNFRPILWSEVQPNEVVYIPDGDGNVLGPHQVVDMENRTLKNVALGQTYTMQDEVLMYKQGPFIAIALLNGTFAGVYADIPLEVAVTRMDDDGPHLFVTRSHRPRPIDCIPTDYQQALTQSLPAGWPEFFGKWDVSAIVVPGPQEEEPTITFRINNNSLATNALMAELVKANKKFTVNPCAPHSVDFWVTHEVYAWMIERLHDLLDGVGGVHDG